MALDKKKLTRNSVSVCGFVHEWEIERRKAATRSLSDGRNERSHDKKDNDDDADGGPSNPAAPSYSAVLNQTMNTAGQPGSTVAAGGPSSYNTSSNIPFTTIRIPANFPYVTCDRCRARNRECHLDVYNQYCADCYCIGRKCFVNEVNTKEIWDDYTAQNPGAKALWVTPNYVTPIPNRQKRKAVAAGKKGVNNSAKESNDA